MIHIQGIKTVHLLRAEQGADGPVHLFKLADRHVGERQADNDREVAANDNHALTIAPREGA
jgi:hypothetical protein